MEQKINIHETAFVTASFRAADSDLSRDNFAHLWANEVTDRHASKYMQSVSLYEGVAHCLRNRYFLDTLQRLIDIGQIDTLINFGCGFSMYPFHLPPTLLYIEIDTPDVVAYKKERTESWQGEGILPVRDLRYVEADFNSPSLEDLYLAVHPLVQDRKCFILLEGVLFFLGQQDTVRLFELFTRLQGKDTYMGSVSFTPELEKMEVFQKLIEFVEGNLEKNQQFNYQTIPHNFYRTLQQYELEDHQDTLSLAGRYISGHDIRTEEVLVENMYLLRKK
ncbi:Leucine carboxyl methyltransferase [Muriicola jejuensis]|uniref:Adenosine deaminase n=1 Tax=Muriicola jejuensis TaxID=504488 RepID=A0A6P0UF24_9FLAO|nr:class I SAM-dependent methyltransferase [Muriicola jejuensis]NER10489.1 adenosine deaminase [Muriicola jejuensis]SMP18533.1 Leucine carboxyl methyltransferase [Muriicola jejuensis]